MYKTVARNKATAKKISILSVSSLRLYFVSRFRLVCITPPIPLNSSCVSWSVLDECTTKEKREIKVANAGGGWTCVCWFPYFHRILHRFTSKFADTSFKVLKALNLYEHLVAVVGYSEKVYFKSQGTGTRVLDDTRPFWRSSIVCFWIPLTCSKERKFTFSGNTGTPEMFQYSPILGCSSILDLKYTLSGYSNIQMSQTFAWHR